MGVKEEKIERKRINWKFDDERKKKNVKPGKRKEKSNKNIKCDARWNREKEKPEWLTKMERII